MQKYRTHLCSELSIKNLNEDVILSGWIDTIRDHGNLLFVDRQRIDVAIPNSILTLSISVTEVVTNCFVINTSPDLRMTLTNSFSFPNWNSITDAPN